MEKMNEETRGEITKVSADVNLVRDEMSAQFAKITSLILQLGQNGNDVRVEGSE